MKRLASALFACAILAPLSSACTTEDDLLEGELVKSEAGKADSSAVGVFLDLEFDGELLANSASNAAGLIEDQLFYTVGQLNGRNAVGRLDKVELSNIRTSTASGRTKITYHAKLPVVWGSKTNLPSSVELILPRDMASAAITKFAADFGATCVEPGDHEIDAGSMWYYYRPLEAGCSLPATRVVRTTASAALSAVSTTGKFPEYNKIWEDNALNVVAIFGKYEDGATTASDAGIAAYNKFISAMKTELRAYSVTTVPATVPTSPGVAARDVQFVATLPGGKTIKVNALLTDNVRTALGTSAFKTRYEGLSTRADLIIYNGHAGLGANVRALARAGKWVKGQYLIMFENGCDTYAYIDGAINESHAAVNSDDPTGTKYVDSIANGMPAFFSSMPTATLSIFRGLVGVDTPKTYEQIFAGIDRSQVVLVTGEQDNTFQPGTGGQPQPWEGLNVSSTVARNGTKKYSTPVLAAGTYQFDMTGTGDADLYLRIGSAPTTTVYDCRPYEDGSNESCQVTLTAPAALFVNVRGAATTSAYELVGKKI